MRKSTILLVPKSIHGPRISLFLLALFTVLAASSPVTAQEETGAQVAVHTATYAALGKGGATDVVKKKSEGVTIPIKVTPNPTTGSFRAKMFGSKDELVRVEILDNHGRIIDSRLVSAGAELRFGYWYHPGTYFIHLVQGENRKKIKLVKVVD